MPRHVSKLAQNEQPINWKRAFLAGVLSASFMMAFIDIFNMMGITRFSFEVYLGSLLNLASRSRYEVHNWTIGVFANWILGGIFGFFYAYCFESIFRKADGRVGTFLGFGHAILAAIAFFPFFGIVHEFSGTGLYSDFGFFGSGLDAATPILLLVGHLLFGASIGTFYGPVRAARVRYRFFEPGETGLPGEPGVIREEDDPKDRMAV